MRPISSSALGIVRVFPIGEYTCVLMAEPLSTAGGDAEADEHGTLPQMQQMQA